MAREKRDHLSFSAFMKYRNCPQHAWHDDYEAGEKERTKPMIEGQMLEDLLFKGNAQELIMESPETFFSWPTLAVIRHHYPELEKVPLKVIQKRDDASKILMRTGDLASNYANILALAEVCKQDKIFMDYIIKGELQKELDFEIDGIPWVGRLDIENDLIIDLKATGHDLDKKEWSSEFGSYVKTYMARRYDIQLALYQYALESSKPCALLMVCTDGSQDRRLIRIPQDRLNRALADVIDLNETIWGFSQEENKDNVPRCEQCTYCKQTRNVIVEDADDWPDEFVRTPYENWC